VVRAQGGDKAAFTQLAGEIGDRLFALAYRILRDADVAEDAAQQAIISIWRQLPGLRDPDRFDAWAHRVLVRSCYREMRRARRHDVERPLQGDVGEGVADPAITVADREQLERGFQRLPAEQRTAIVLQHYLGYTLPQIAEILDIPVGTVSSRLHAARRTMRAALEADRRPGPVRGIVA